MAGRCWTLELKLLGFKHLMAHQRSSKSTSRPSRKATTAPTFNMTSIDELFKVILSPLLYYPLEQSLNSFQGVNTNKRKLEPLRDPSAYSLTILDYKQCLQQAAGQTDI